jgi:hypothetical protein
MARLNKTTKVLIAGTAAAVAGATLLKMKQDRQAQPPEPELADMPDAVRFEMPASGIQGADQRYEATP